MVEAFPCEGWLGSQGFCALTPHQDGEASQGLSCLSAIGGRVPQELWDARTVTMATAAPGKPEVAGDSPSPMQVLPGREGASRLPAHPPGFVTRSHSLQRWNNTRRLTERETMRRTRGDREEGDYHQCPPPFLPHWAEGARGGGRWEQNPSQQLLAGGAWLHKLPCTIGKGHFPDL